MSTNGLPPIIITEPPGTPHTGGLYAASTIDDRGEDRHSAGVLLEASDTGAHGQWPAGCLPDGHEAVKGGAEDCPGLTPFPATVVWASDDRLLVGITEEEARLAAAHTLHVVEQVDAEAYVGSLLADRAGSPASAVGSGADAVVAALGAVESALGKVGVVHAPRSVAAIAASRNLIIERAGKLYTPLGNRWAFGVGYATALAGRIIATGPVTVHRGPVTTSQAVDTRYNQRLVVAERHVAVSWSGPTVAAATA